MENKEEQELIKVLNDTFDELENLTNACTANLKKIDIKDIKEN